MIKFIIRKQRSIILLKCLIIFNYLIRNVILKLYIKCKKNNDDSFNLK